MSARWDGRLRADARHLPIADGSVQCCVTSPPYWGLRRYAVEGDQAGMESTPELYVSRMVEVFREVFRVLREDGTLWLNLGDTFWSTGGDGGTMSASGLVGGEKRQQPRPESVDPAAFGRWNRKNHSNIKPKDLVGIPWMVAFALRADGWYLRSDIIWHKPNPMPESVTDRPTRSHEYIFLLSKSERYAYDASAIAEPAMTGTDLGLLRGRSFADGANVSAHAPSIQKRQLEGVDSRTAGDGTRNKRDVWTVATAPYAEAHYATFPPDLIEPCILAGSKVGDVVLDPFFGSGTVGMVAEKHNRRWIGCDLGYQHLQAKRTTNVQKMLVI